MVVIPIMTLENKALELFKAQKNGILRTSHAIRLGIHPVTLYKLRDDGKITAIIEGFYRLSDLPDLAEPDLVTVSLKIPKAVICLISALSVHDITTQIPHEVDIALPKWTKTPRLSFPPIHSHLFSSATYSDGIDIKIFDGVEVKIYNPAKTVVDCFRYEQSIGLDVAIEAMKLARQKNKCKASQIMHHAKIAKISNKIKPFVQQEFA